MNYVSGFINSGYNIAGGVANTACRGVSKAGRGLFNLGKRVMDTALVAKAAIGHIELKASKKGDELLKAGYQVAIAAYNNPGAIVKAPLDRAAALATKAGNIAKGVGAALVDNALELASSQTGFPKDLIRNILFALGNKAKNLTYNNQNSLTDILNTLTTLPSNKEIQAIKGLIDLVQNLDFAGMQTKMYKGIKIGNFFNTSLAAGLMEIKTESIKVERALKSVDNTELVKVAINEAIKYYVNPYVEKFLGPVTTVEETLEKAKVWNPVIDFCIKFIAVIEIVGRVVVGYFAAFIADLHSMINNKDYKNFYYVNDNTNRILEITKNWASYDLEKSGKN
jgi:hypothetical protein